MLPCSAASCSANATYRHCLLVGLPRVGCSFQFGRTSTSRPPALAALHPAPKRRHSDVIRIARHVDHGLMAAGIVVAECDQPMHAERVHVPEGHRRACGVLENQALTCPMFMSTLPASDAPDRRPVLLAPGFVLGSAHNPYRPLVGCSP